MTARHLDGRVALVTGAGHGIGLAIAAKLGAVGASVVVNDLTQDVADGAVAAVEAGGGRAVACQGDVTAREFPARIVQAALDSFGVLDIVVNNAGYATYADAIDISDRQWAQVVDVLLTAPFRILRAAGAYFREHADRSRPRRTVNIASVAGIAGSPGSASYAAAKAGLIGLTRTLAKEWGALRSNSQRGGTRVDPDQADRGPGRRARGHRCRRRTAAADRRAAGGPGARDTTRPDTASPLNACAQCQDCLSGNPQHCRSLQIIGIHRDGAFADADDVPVRNLVAVADGVSPLVASMAEPVAVVTRAVRLADAEVGSRVLVLGQAPSA